MRHAILGLAAACLLASCASEAPAPRPAPEPGGPPADCSARLIAETTSVRPGAPASVGLHFRLAPHHHLSWKNPGDAGLPPTVAWTLPPGWSAGEIAWPAPRKTVEGELVSYVYEDEVLLPVSLTVPPGARPGEAVLVAHVKWLVCSAGACVPGEARCELRIDVRDEAPKSDMGFLKAFVKARFALPARLAPGAASLEGLVLTVDGIDASGAVSAELMPLESGLFDETRPAEIQVAEKSRLRLALAPASRRTEPVRRLRGVLLLQTTTNRLAYEIDASISESSPR